MVGGAFRGAAFTITFLFCAATLAGCGGSGTSVTPSVGFCIPFDAQPNEVAAYLFTDSEGRSDTVRITVTSVSGPIVTMQIEEGGTVQNVEYDTTCELGRNPNVSFSEEVQYLFSGGGWLPKAEDAPEIPTPDPGPGITPAPPPVPVISFDCELAEVTTSAGTFTVERCLYVFDEGGDYQSYEMYGMEKMEPRPLTFGVVKGTTNFADGSVRNVELVEWNGI
jgi:hypothetical protein